MRRLFPALLIGLLALPACNGAVGLNTIKGSGVIVTEEHKYGGKSDVQTIMATGVTGVELDTSGDLTVIQGEAETLVIETDDNIISTLTSTNQNQKLVLGTKPNTSINPTSLKYTLNVIDFNEIVLNGSGNVTITTLNSSDLKITVNGSGNVTINNLSANSLTVKGSGSGNITLTGTIPQVDVQLSGSGDLIASTLTTETAKISISGSGDAALKVNQTLDATISGNGSITYSGDATVTKNVTGSGDVNKAG